MDRLTLTNMRIFIAVVEEGGFTAAALRLNATQSGVSQQIRRLEDGLGVPLLLRSPTGAAPTPAGRRLYRQAVDILRDVAAAERSVADYNSGLAGSIRLGLMPALTRGLAGPVQRRITAENPNLHIALTERLSGEVIDAVAAGQLDLGIVPAFNAPDAIRARPVGRTREVLVHRRGNGDHMREIAAEALSPLRLVLQSPGTIRREAILTRLKAAGVEIAEVLDLDSMFATLEFVENSDFATILPAVMMAREIETEALCIRPIAPPFPELEMIAIEPASRDPSPLAPLVTDAFGAAIAGHGRFVARMTRR